MEPGMNTTTNPEDNFSNESHRMPTWKRGVRCELVVVDPGPGKQYVGNIPFNYGMREFIGEMLMFRAARPNDMGVWGRDPDDWWISKGFYWHSTWLREP